MYNPSLVLSSVLLLGIAAPAGSVFAQQKSLKEQLIGTWTLASWDGTRPDVTKYRDFGDNPKGVNTFDANGWFTAIFLRPDLPKTASGDRINLTPDEALIFARGSLSYFGTYNVVEADKMIVLRLESTTFPNGASSLSSVRQN
jgi:hypothetical protein